MNTVKQNGAHGAPSIQLNGQHVDLVPHSDGAPTATRRDSVWDFLTATARDEQAFRRIRDDFPVFDLRDVPEADGAACLLWVLMCEHEAGAVQHGRPLDDIVADTLRLVADVNPDAHVALAWLRDPNATCYALSEAPRVAARLVKEWSKPAPAPRFKFTSLSELRARPRPDDLIEDFIVAGTAVVFSGDSQSFKTFAALDMALCIATGAPWHGRAVVRGPVVYICAEGGWTIRDRLEAWETAHGITVSDADFHLLEVPVQMGDPATVAAFVAFIENVLPVFVVIDTLSACAQGLKENDNSDMSTFVRHMKDVSRATGATCGTIAHNNKNGGLRGGGALENDADTRITFERSGEENDLTTVLSCAKHRAKHFTKFALRGEEITLAEPDKRGRPVTSLVLHLCDLPEGEPKAAHPKTTRANETRVNLLQIFDEIAREMDGVKIGTWKARTEEAGVCSDRAFWRYRKAIENDGIIFEDGDVFRRTYGFTATTATTANGSSGSRIPNTETLTATTATIPLGSGSSGSGSKGEKTSAPRKRLAVESELHNSTATPNGVMELGVAEPKPKARATRRKAANSAQSEPYQADAPTKPRTEELL